MTEITITHTAVRRIHLPSPLTQCVADAAGHVYVSEEAVGIWRFNADAEIQGILKKLGSDKPGAGKYSKSAAQALKSEIFDRKAIAARGLDYERLDQHTTAIILGSR